MYERIELVEGKLQSLKNVKQKNERFKKEYFINYIYISFCIFDTSQEISMRRRELFARSELASDDKWGEGVHQINP